MNAPAITTSRITEKLWAIYDAKQVLVGTIFRRRDSAYFAVVEHPIDGIQVKTARSIPEVQNFATNILNANGWNTTP